MDDDESAWEHISAPLARVLEKTVVAKEAVQKSDLESLSDVVEQETIPIENMRQRDRLREIVEIGSYNGGNSGARSAFYNPRNRKPSLPKLKFLEGKD